MKKYDEDSAARDYNRALLLYSTPGISAESGIAPRKACESNRCVQLLFPGDVTLPRIAIIWHSGGPTGQVHTLRHPNHCGLIIWDHKVNFFNGFTEYLKDGEKAT